LCSLGLVAVNAARLGLLGSAPIRIFAAQGAPAPVTAVFLSGDMGFNFGLSGKVAAALAARGVRVTGVVSPVAFASHRTKAQAASIVEEALDQALHGNEGGRLILIGESYGADIVSVAAPRLPARLLNHIDAIQLIVPAPDVYFRADPTGLAYMGDADAHPLPALKQLRKPPLVCIYGEDEPDSLCPYLRQTAAKLVALPGGHYLNHDPARLIQATIASLRDVVSNMRQPEA
jgi:type IV secretory pathway VirJ component